MKYLLTLAVLVMAPMSFLHAEESAQLSDALRDQGFSHIELKVDGVDREALVYAPKSAATTVTPVVFVFHGHGGSSQQVSRSIAMHREWPEAISVYMQGLDTPGGATDQEGKKHGWQHGLEDQKGRDFKFFDALLAKLKEAYKIDEKRIFATGHSNGGGFTYLLWETRPDVFAAFALASTATRHAPKLKPKPALIVAGEKDPLVKFEAQKQTMEALKKNNGCDEEGKPWDDKSTIYFSKSGLPVVAFFHPGGHEFPAAATAEIAKFFKGTPPMENSALEKPAGEKPTAEKLTVEKPTAEKPTVEKPTAEKPAVEKSTVEKPTAEKPAVEKPTVEKPASR